jgi:ferredoxin
MPETAADGWTVVVDRDICMGTGMCVVYAPAAFSQDEDTKSVFRAPYDADPAAVRTAVEACPTGALTLMTDEREV